MASTPATRRPAVRPGSFASWTSAGLVVGGLVLLIAAAVTEGTASSTTTHVNRAFVYTTWVKDSQSTGGPHPGYRPALTGLTGADIASATASLSPGGSNWVVDVKFTPRGKDLFDRLTATNVAACPVNVTTGAVCPERYLTLWLGLGQRDLDRWDDPSAQAELMKPYLSGCSKPDGTCGKLLVDAVTLDEIKGGSAEISGNFSQHDAENVANVTETKVDPVKSAIATGFLVIGLLAVVMGIVSALMRRGRA